MLASIVAILVFTHLADASPFIRRQRNSQSEAYAFLMTESSGTIVDDYETRQLYVRQRPVLILATVWL
jgi:hypothetical protein